MKKIKYALEKNLYDVNGLVSAKNYIPDWYKNTSRFYNTDRDYNVWNAAVPGMQQITNKPLCSAKIGPFGAVISQAAPLSTTLTGWAVNPNALANYGRNVYQETNIV